MTIAGVALTGPIEVARAREGEVVLEAGEAARLTAEQTAYLRLPALPDAEYSLVMLDTRQIDISEVGSAPGQESDVTYTVREAGLAAWRRKPDYLAGARDRARLAGGVHVPHPRRERLPDPRLLLGP